MKKPSRKGGRRSVIETLRQYELDQYLGKRSEQGSQAAKKSLVHVVVQERIIGTDLWLLILFVRQRITGHVGFT